MLIMEKAYNDAEKILGRELLDIRDKLQHYTPDSLTGREYRGGILNQIKKGDWSEKKYTHLSNKSIGVDTISISSSIPVGLSMQVSHTDGGKAQLLDFESLYRGNQVKGCIFITQTFSEAKKRNKAANPNSAWGNTGNRIHFEYLVEQMVILQKFLKCPLVIIGLQSD